MDDDERGAYWGNVEEVGSDNHHEDDDNDHEDSDEEESEDDDDSTSDGEIENMEKFIRTFHNGDFDSVFDNAFSFERKRNVTLADRPTRPTQASYDKPDNWVERNQIGLEKIRERLQNYIYMVSNVNCFNFDLKYNRPWEQLVDNEEPIVWHNAILDHYWDQLEKNCIKGSSWVSQRLEILQF
jgi:hypothetical protein